MKLLLVLSLFLVVLYHVTAQGLNSMQDQNNRVTNMNYLRELMASRLRAKQGEQRPIRRPFVPRPRFMPINNLLAGAYLAQMDAFDDLSLFDNF